MKNYFRNIIIFFIYFSSFNVYCTDWQPIYWAGQQKTKSEISKEAFLIKLKIDGITTDYYVNFDTGAADSFLFKNVIEKAPELAEYFHNEEKIKISKNYHDIEDFGYSVKGNIIGKRLSGNAFLLNNLIPAVKSSVIGIVGLGAFSQPYLAIDFINNRIINTNNIKEIEIDINKPFIFEKYQDIDGLPAVLLNDKSEKLGKFVFDTGSSNQEIVLFNLETWIKLTGVKINDKSNEYKSIISLGHKFFCAIHISQKELNIGTINLGKPNLQFCLRDGIAMQEKGLDGIIGSRLFYEKAIVLIDIKNKEIGFSFNFDK
ncbi:MAG TPA: hypothetical protein VJ603_08165 [Paucimonas sp.]|nr:hypothetical protein [Paucimonas sp.]